MAFHMQSINVTLVLIFYLRKKFRSRRNYFKQLHVLDSYVLNVCTDLIGAKRITRIFTTSRFSRYIYINIHELYNINFISDMPSLAKYAISKSITYIKQYLKIFKTSKIIIILFKTILMHII